MDFGLFGTVFVKGRSNKREKELKSAGKSVYKKKYSSSMIGWIHIRQLADTGSPPNDGLATNYTGDMFGHSFFISTF